MCIKNYSSLIPSIVLGFIDLYMINNGSNNNIMLCLFIFKINIINIIHNINFWRVYCKKKNVFNYNLLINIRDINKRTNRGNVFFENTYIITTSNIKAKVIWFIK